ncbi:hypothetical protein M8J75_012583 [Diaphorina citri]|nr:hypothetical protein M8J75_012583 [Diaphorina citri]
MANPTNGNGNIVDEFEEAFHSCLQVLTKEDEVSTTLEKDEIKLEIDQATLKFLDLARQMEAFFLQKRFLLSALKPELIVKEDIVDLRHDLARKEELIKRHYDKIAVWQNLLSDLQGWAKSPAHQGSTSSASGTTPPNSTPTQSGPGISAMGGPLPGMMGGMAPIVPGSTMQPMSGMPQQQQVQMQQQIHMQHMQQQGMGPGGPPSGPGGPSSGMMFMGPGGPRGGGNAGPPPFPSAGPGGMGGPGNLGPGGMGPGGLLQGPLAYLEKTTSNIGLPDGRR